jgi:hypothetical protein
LKEELMASTPSPGDFTAKEALRLQRENAEEIAQRRHQVGLVGGGVEEAVDESAIYDPASGQRLDLTPEEIQALPTWSAPDEDEEEVMEVGADYAVIKPLQDLENVTYGIGNTLSFSRGRRYRVSREVATHLVSRRLAEIVR